MILLMSGNLENIVPLESHDNSRIMLSESLSLQRESPHKKTQAEILVRHLGERRRANWKVTRSPRSGQQMAKILLMSRNLQALNLDTGRVRIFPDNECTEKGTPSVFKGIEQSMQEARELVKNSRLVLRGAEDKTKLYQQLSRGRIDETSTSGKSYNEELVATTT